MKVLVFIGIFLFGYLVGGLLEYKRLADKDKFVVKLLETLFLKVSLEELNNIIEKLQYDKHKTRSYGTTLDKAVFESLLLKRNKLIKKT